MDELERLLSQLQGEEAEGASGAFEEDDESEADLELQIDDGEICGNCHGTFLTEQGEASLCPPCWDNASEDEREGYVKSSSGTAA